MIVSEASRYASFRGRKDRLTYAVKTPLFQSMWAITSLNIPKGEHFPPIIPEDLPVVGAASFRSAGSSKL